MIRSGTSRAESKAGETQISDRGSLTLDSPLSGNSHGTQATKRVKITPPMPCRSAQCKRKDLPCSCSALERWENICGLDLRPENTSGAERKRDVVMIILFISQLWLLRVGVFPCCGGIFVLLFALSTLAMSFLQLQEDHPSSLEIKSLTTRRATSKPLSHRRRPSLCLHVCIRGCTARWYILGQSRYQSLSVA